MTEGKKRRIEVLDKGFVDLIESMGNDLTIVNAARVSFAKHKTEWDESDRKLLRYLVLHKHTSPFEHVQFQFRIKCPLYIRSQWHRHRTWHFNEVSRRYTDKDIDQYYMPSTFRSQSKDNRQASTAEPVENEVELLQCYNTHMNHALDLYRALIDAGACREQARGVLPQAFYTEFYGTVDLHNLLHFIGLRIASGAQHEIRLYARALLELIQPVVPETHAFFCERLRKDGINI